MSTFQFVAIDPKQLQEDIAVIIKSELKALLSEFKKMQPDELLTRAEVAQMLKVNISTVNNWKKSGDLIAYGYGSQVRFRRSEIEQNLKQIKI